MADYKEEFALKQKIADTETRINALRTASTGIDEKAIIALQERQDRLQAQLSLEQEANELRTDSQKELENEIKLLDDGVEKRQKQYELEKLKLEELKKQKDVTDEQIEKQKEDLERAKQAYKQEREATANYERQNSLKEKALELYQKIHQKVDLVTDGSYTQITNFFTLNGILGTIGKLFGEILSSSTQLVAVTGQMNLNFTGTVAGLADYGVGLTEVSKAGGVVFTTMSNFSNLNKTMQVQLTVSAAKMERLGVSASVTGKNYNELNKALRMNATEAMQTNEQLAQAAIGAGIAPQKMLEEFASSMPKLAAYGKDAINIYVGLQKQAKALGMEMGSLTNIVGDQFDTFEGSARAAGKLNAVLGGNYLNSVDMLNASEEERVMMIKQSLEQSGKSFDSLDKYQKKALAATLNITDMSEASKFFGTSTTDVTKEMDKQAVTQEKLAKTQLATVTEVEKLVKTLQADFMPTAKTVVKVVERIIDAFRDVRNWLNKTFGEGTFTLVMFGTAIALAFGGKIVSAISGIVSLFKKVGGATKSLPEAGKNAGKGIGNLSEGLKKLSGPQILLGIVAIGVAVIAIGYGIKIASEGLAKLVQSFQGLTGPQAIAAVAGLIVVMVGFVAIISTLGTVMMAGPGAAAAVGLLALGAAFMMVAVGINIMTDSLIRMQPLIVAVGKVVMEGLVRIFDRLMLAVETIFPYLRDVAIVIIKEFGSIVKTLAIVIGTVLVVALNGLKEIIIGIYAPIVKLVDVVGTVLVKAFDSLVEIVKILANTFENVILGVFDKIILLSEKEGIAFKLAAIGGGLITLAGGFTALVVPLKAFPNDDFDRFALAAEKLSNINIASEGLEKFVIAIKNVLNSLNKDMIKDASERLELFAKSASISFPIFVIIAQNSAPAILIIASSITALTTSLKKLMEITGFSESLSVISGAIVVFANQFIALDPAIGAMNTLSETLNKLTITFTTMFNVVSGRATGFGLNAFSTSIIETSVAIQVLAASLNQLPDNKTIEIKNLSESIIAVKSIKEEDLKPTKEFVKISKEYYEIQAKSKDADSDAIVAALRELNAKNKEEESEEGKEITLIVDGTAFANAINSFGKKRIKAILHSGG